VKRVGVVLPPTRGSWDAFSTAAPVVWKEEGVYYMLYQGWKRPEEGNWRTEPGRLIGLATSKDGLRWEKYDGNPVVVGDRGSWDETGFEVSYLVKVDGEYRLYYTGLSDGIPRIGLAFSNDLRTWRKYEGNPILDIGPKGSFDENGVAFPSVLKCRDGWRMIYGGYGPLPERTCQLGLAISNDGLRWEKYPHNPVHRTRSWMSFDAYIEAHHTFSIGDHYVTLHEAIGRDNRYNIGVIYSPDLTVWARCPENPLFPLTEPSVKQDMSVVHPWLLLEDLMLYYVEVNGFRVLDQHVIKAAKIKPELLVLHRQRSLSFPLWFNRRVSPNGEISSAIPCETFNKKTFYLVSDKDGTVKVEIDPAGLDQWVSFRECTIRAGQLWFETITYSFDRTRLVFNPVEDANVLAYIILEKE
jgi:predicted GH43/DUF377 family glycosyl hydrolase